LVLLFRNIELCQVVHVFYTPLIFH
jgi:hypothetical protein